MPLGKSKDAKVSAEYKKHGDEIMENARKKAEEKKLADYRQAAITVFVASNLEDAIQKLMEKFEIKRK